MKFLTREVNVDRPPAFRFGGGNEALGLWGWFGLYLSGAVLLFFILSHLWVIHYSPTGHELSWKSIFENFKDYYIIRIIDIGLLVFCIIHGLLGFRRIILDLEFLSKSGDKWLIGALIIIGIMLFIFGLVIFVNFISPSI